MQTAQPDSVTKPEAKKIRVFISYARKDDYLTPVAHEEEHTYHHDPARSFTRRLYNALTAAGFDVWWDREKMPSRGLTFLEEIRQAVHQQDKLVYVAGKNAIKSDYVKAEWEYALSQCKPVIAVLRNGDYDVIPAAIGMSHAPDMRDMDFFDAKVQELIGILRDPAIPPATLHSVPILPDWYIERGSHVQDLQEAVRVDALKPVVVTSKQQTVALHGMGGLGKSTLAAALCRSCEVRHSFADGIFWIEMGKTPSIASRQGDIGAAFGDLRDEYHDEQRGKSRLSAVLRDKAVLMVLDDVWDLRHVEAFRVNSPASRIVVTTRDGRMANLLGVTQHTINTLTEEEGVALIGRRLGRAEGDAGDHAEAERELVRLLGGHTLAISITAARIAEENGDYAPRYLKRLQERRAKGVSPLGDLKMHEGDKDFNVELSLAESYDALTPAMQTYFRALGVFALEGSFDQDAARHVWQMDDVYEAEDTLKALVKLALTTENHEGRYRLHNLLRDYARALAEKAGELDSVCARHFDHYHTLHSDDDANNDEDTHPQISLDWENIQAALEWGLRHVAAKAVDWVGALRYFMGLRRTSQERLDLLNRALRTAQNAQYRWGEARCLYALGDVHYMRAEYGEAVARYGQALALFRAVGDPQGQAHCLLVLGEVHRMRAEYGEAVERLQQALDLYQTIGDRLGEAHCLKALGDVHYVRAEYGEAVERLQQALDLYQTIGDRQGQAHCLKALGDVHYVRAEYGEAVERLQQALDLYQTIGDRQGQANCLKALGEVHYMRAEYGEAVGRYGRALDLYQTIGDRLGEAHCLIALGEVHYMRAEYGEAVGRYGQALDLYQTIGDRLGQANCLLALGDVHRMKNEYSEAVERYEQALQLANAIGNFSSQLNSLRGLAFSYQAQGQNDTACPYARQCLALAGSHDFFKDHPTTQKLREAFASWGCEGM